MKWVVISVIALFLAVTVLGRPTEEPFGSESEADDAKESTVTDGATTVSEESSEKKTRHATQRKQKGDRSSSFHKRESSQVTAESPDDMKDGTTAEDEQANDQGTTMAPKSEEGPSMAEGFPMEEGTTPQDEGATDEGSTAAPEEEESVTGGTDTTREEEDVPRSADAAATTESSDSVITSPVQD